MAAGACSTTCARMVFLNAYTLNTPEIFIGGGANKIQRQDWQSLTDEATDNFIEQQLAGFEAMIRKIAGK